MFAAYLLLALWATWPLVPNLTSALPVATESVATVPLLNLWTIWWNADRAAQRFHAYWDAPIFHPATNTFAFSEPQPTSLVVAPLVWLCDTPAAAYNVYLLAALTLNGWSTFCLVRRVQSNWLAAFLGGAMLEMLPFVHWQMGVLQLVPLCGVVWTIDALDRFARQPGLRRSIVLGLAFAVTYLLCAYHGLFLSVLLLAAGGWLAGRGLFAWRTWVWLLPALVACLILTAPVLRAHLRVSKEEGFRRDIELIRSLSAEGGDYTITPWPQLAPWPDLADPIRRQYWFLSPGMIKLALALAGIVVGLATPRLRRWTAFCVTFVVAAYLLSLGPKLKLGTWVPYQALMDHYPGFGHIRNVFRFSLFVQIAVVLLAAVALEPIVLAPLRLVVFWALSAWRRAALLVRPAPQARLPAATLPAATEEARLFEKAGLLAAVFWSALRPHLPRVFLAAAGLLATFEVRPPSQKLFVLPRLQENRAWLDWLRLRTPPDAAVACVPFPPGTEVTDYLDTTLWMYWGTYHKRPLVNGYSGFFPEPFLTLKDAMVQFPNAASVELLERSGAAYLVVRRSAASRTRIEWMRPAAVRLRWVFGDDAAGVDIYRITRSPP